MESERAADVGKGSDGDGCCGGGVHGVRRIENWAFKCIVQSDAELLRDRKDGDGM